MSRWKVLAAVAYALFTDYFIYGLVVPLTPHSPVGSMSEDKLAILFASYAVGVLGATPLFGYLGDRLGCRPPMIIGVVLSALTTLLFWFAPTYSLLILARICQGAASAATWTAGLALIATTYPTRRVEMMGYALTGSVAGSIVGPTLGGALYDWGGFSLPFMVTGALVAIDAVLRLLLLPADRPGTQASAPLRRLLTDRTILVPAMAVGVAAFGWGITEPLFPERVARFGATPSVIGLMLTLATVFYGLSAPLVNWASDRMPVKRVIAVGTASMAVSLVLVGLAPGILFAGAALCLLSIAFAFTLNPTSAELGNAVERLGLACYAAVYAVYNIAYSVGMMATGALATLASRELGFLNTLLCAAIALLIFTPLFLLKDAPASASNN